MREQVPLKCHGMGGRSTIRGEIYGNVFDHHAVVYEYASGVRLYAFCRTIPDCYNENSSILLGTKGRCNLSRGRIEGETKWEYSGPKLYSTPLINPYQIEQIEFMKSIRSGKPINSADYMTGSTLTGIMGQLSCYSGKEVTWEQASASDFYYPPKPEDVRADMEPPVKPGAGRELSGGVHAGGVEAAMKPLAAMIVAGGLLLAQKPNLRDGVKLSERGRQTMVVSGDETATRAGLDVLRAGGNAMDAAVAIGFVLAVTLPAAGNLGGGGMMLVHPANGESVAIDYREMLPMAARPEQFKSERDRYAGVRSIGVPGTVAALGIAHARYGSKPWAEVLEPALRLARDGMRVGRRTETIIATLAGELGNYPETGRVFLPGGKPPREGDLLKQPELATTIARLQKLGWKEFYRGELARQIVADLRSRGSLITQDDWESYEARVEPPLRGSYRGSPVITMPPGTSGGVALLEMLNILEQFQLDPAKAGSADTWHLMIEAMTRADYDRRRWHGDRGLAPAQPEALIAKEHGKAMAGRIRMDRATPSASLPAESAKPDQTTHYAVVDAAGNIVANTYTLQGSMGSMVMPKGTGVLMSGAAAYFDAGSGNANDIGPRKRAIFSMAPTIVLRPDGKPWLVLGLSGGNRIPNILMQLIVSIVDFGLGLRDAVDAPRVHRSYQPDELTAEWGAFSPDTAEKLRARGHKIVMRMSPLGDANAIMIDQWGRRYGWSDGRLGGKAMGY